MLLPGDFMQKIRLLKNTVQAYAWGSTDAIPKLLGLTNPLREPQAELWMGAHPKAPSMVACKDGWRSLLDFIEKDAQDVLGKQVALRYDNKLPYLFKVLAAAKPLSVQAHPNSYQAKEGFQRENNAGIPLNSPERNYRDSSHKPECIFALSPFWAVCGFRKISEILMLFRQICPQQLRAELAQLRGDQNPGGLKRFFSKLMTLGDKSRQKVIGEALSNLAKGIEHDIAYQWIQKLAEEYPEDIGIFSPMLLNLICLEPGEAIFLEAGILHAYLDGTGIELMANSDNVLRGGLTPKHIDVAELLNVLQFEEKPIHFIKPVSVSEFETVYPCPAEEFVLSVINLAAEGIYVSPAKRSVEIVLCTDGAAELTHLDKKEVLSLNKGASALIPAAVPRYALKGEATLYKASVPIFQRR
jgi:mannose-6-phosphate isomerase